MKALSQKSTRVIGILLITAAPFFINNNWKKAAKPTFKERVMAEAEAGRKVAVFVNHMVLSYQHSASSNEELCRIGKGMTTKSGPEATMHFIYTSLLEESIPSGYQKMGEMVTEQLNKEMGINAFEAVPQSAIETKIVRVLEFESKVADWRNSDYKVIVELSPGVRYETAEEVDPMKTRLTSSTFMNVREVVEGKKKLGFIVNDRNLGIQNTVYVEHNECYSSLDELKASVYPPDALLERSLENIAEPLAKFIEKENAKYDKAMKKKKKKS